MSDQPVRLLYALRFFRRNREQEVDASGQTTAALARKPRGVTAGPASRIHGAQNVSGFPTGAYGNEDVSFGGQGLHLASERLFETEVIRDSGENRGIGSQRDCRQWLSLKLKSSDKFCGKVLRIGRAPSIARQEHLLAAPIGDDSPFGQSPDIFQQFHGKAPFYGAAFLDLLAKKFERRLFGYSHFPANFVAQFRSSLHSCASPADGALQDNTKAWRSYAGIAVSREICYPYCNSAIRIDSAAVGGDVKPAIILPVSSAGARMKYVSMAFFFIVLLFPLRVPAQNGGSAPGSANDGVTLGRRLFQQNCSICHTQATVTNPMYGPSLYRDIVNGKEDAVRDYIAKGSNKMPGFRYGLKASEINAIVEYLKTLPKPAPRGPQAKGEERVD